MTIWLRKFYLKEVIDWRNKEQAEHDKLSKKGQAKPPSFSKTPPKR